MNKFNRKFNNICSRLSFWQVMCAHFNGFVNLLKAPNSLTHEDMRTLHEVHNALFELYKACKVRKNFHSNELKRLLRKEHKSCR